MRAILNSGEHLTGRTARDIVAAWRDARAWGGVEPAPLDRWMAETLTAWRKNGYEFTQPALLTAEAFLAIMVRVGIVRAVHGTRRAASAIGALGALGATTPPRPPAMLGAWAARGDHWFAEVKDGRAWRLYKTTRGWVVSVGYETGGPFRFLDAAGDPTGGEDPLTAPAVGTPEETIEAARRNAARYAKA